MSSLGILIGTHGKRLLAMICIEKGVSYIANGQETAVKKGHDAQEHEKHTKAGQSGTNFYGYHKSQLLEGTQVNMKNRIIGLTLRVRHTQDRPVK